MWLTGFLRSVQPLGLVGLWLPKSSPVTVWPLTSDTGAYLQFAGVSGGFPVHVAGTLHRNIRSDAIEVGSAAALPGVEFAGDLGYGEIERRLRVDAGVDKQLVFEANLRAPVREPERKPAFEPEYVSSVMSAFIEQQLHRM